jgi:hypothetical protein
VTRSEISGNRQVNRLNNVKIFNPNRSMSVNSLIWMKMKYSCLVNFIFLKVNYFDKLQMGELKTLST